MSPFLAIVSKDILIEMRNKESISSMMLFGLLVVVVFSFALEPGSGRAGVLWIAFTFASVIGLNRSLAMELDNDCLQGLMLAPLSRNALYAAKVASNLVFMLIADFVVMPFFFIFNNINFGWEFIKIFGLAAIGAVGLAGVGTILSTISANTRMREVMLPILQIPLTIPIVIVGYQATKAVLEETPEKIPSLLSVLVGFTIVYLTASYLIFEYVVEE
ncbi:MAG TPA: heme exporter protein CcmB [Terriglobia bacterium]|nr:heme exporter protein CcmB [Terriglobia bacterium]